MARASSDVSQRSTPLSDGTHPHVPDIAAYARTVLAAEAAAIGLVATRLGPSFNEAIEVMLGCRGSIVVTGIGKPGFIAQKLSATFASIGVASLHLHPAEAVHGDLGASRVATLSSLCPTAVRRKRSSGFSGHCDALGRRSSH